MGFHFIQFIITPDELGSFLDPYSIFLGNTRVPLDYVCTSNEEFVAVYSKLYGKLCSGEMIDPKEDYHLLPQYNLTTDITSLKWKQFQNNNTWYKSFDGSIRGYAPCFSPFAFSAYEDKGKIILNTKSSYHVTYCAEIMGYQLYYPKFGPVEKDFYNMRSEKEWLSYSDYKGFKDNVLKNTVALEFRLNSLVKKTGIRISKKAIRDLPDFYCIKSRGIDILI
ncbi:MAG: hypothetical protein IKO44_02280 [Ruminococcus sp.]|nr:hypothetical protein [Ruminococcus sp.]